MVSILLIIAAAIFKAVSDTIAHHKGDSILKGNFWSQDGPFFPHTKYRVDGWHLSNSLMIICFVLCAIFHKSLMPWYWELLIAAFAFNIPFNVFYNRVLR